MNKKGDGVTFFSGHVLNIILAAIGIFLLICIPILIYTGIISPGQRAEQAKVVLNQTMFKINALASQGSDSFLIESPSGWVIIAWPTTGLVSKPRVCKQREYETSCLCICEGLSKVTEITSFSETEFREILSKCESTSTGVCQDTDKKIYIKGDYIKIDGSIELKLALQDNNLTLEKA